MLGGVRRAWHTWRAKKRLIAPMWARPPGCFAALELQFPELRDVFDAGGPALPPYASLAGLWHEYAGPRLPDYPSYLAHICGSPVGAVLDLACGTGILSARLAAVTAEVVGLDDSEAMLSVARRESARPGVTFVAGDMRDFDLSRRFDAVVCASNSLNYVADRGELSRVFACVARHLRPGGVFVFDVFTAYGMRLVSQFWMHVMVGERRFAQTSVYDPAARRETAWVVLPSGVETHPRSPIEKADVRAAAEGTGLVVADQFSSALPLGVFAPDSFTFHVLRRTG